MESSIAHQQSIFDDVINQQETYKEEDEEEYVSNPYEQDNQDDPNEDELIANAEISQDDIEYLNSLDQKLSSKKLSVKAQSLMQALNSQRMSQVGQQEDDNENLPTEHLHLGGGSSSYPLSFHFSQGPENDHVSPIMIATSSHQQTPWIDINNPHSHQVQGISPTGLTSAMYTQQSLQRKLKWSKRDYAIEKLSRSNKDVYIEAARIYKQMEEKKECTFKPKVNQEGRRYTDMQDLFERLHDDRQRRQQHMMFREEQKARFEVQHCTFTPQTVTPKDPTINKTRNHSKNQIYVKLYTDYDSLQRKKLKQQYEREAAFKEINTFKPNLIVSQSQKNKGQSGSDSSLNHQNNDQNKQKNRFEHLYQDYIRRQVELQSKIHEANTPIQPHAPEKRKNQSITAFGSAASVKRSNTAKIDHSLNDSDEKIQNQNNQEKPRYLALYEKFKEKDKKQKALYIKVNMEEGVTFHPMTFRSSSSLVSSSPSASLRGSAKKDKNRDLIRGDQHQTSKYRQQLPPRPTK